MTPTDLLLRLEAEGADPEQVALAPPPGADGAWLARQLKGRRTARHKAPAWLAVPAIFYPPSANLAQASSEATARYKAGLLAGRAVADLCGGMGLDAWFVKPAARAYLFNEPDEALLGLARHNLALAGGPAAAFASRPAEAFGPADLADYDALYLDPSRRQAGGSGRAWSWAQMRPDLTRMDWLWQRPGAVLLKLSPGQDFTQVERHLPAGLRWHVLAVGNECRELLAWLELPGARSQTGHSTQQTRPASPTPPPGQSPRRIAELDEAGRVLHLFDYDPAPAATRLPLNAAEAGLYLHEPGAALLKAGAQDAYAAQAGVLAKLDANTHLYLATAPLPGWWGRTYRITRRLPLESRALQAAGACQVSARNFGLEPEAIRKKYKLSAGSQAHLFFMKDAAGYGALEVERS